MKMNKKLLSSCLAPIFIGASVASIGLVSSCGSTEAKAIEKIYLSTLFGYVTPGSTTKILKDVYPAEAKDQKVNWEITSSPFSHITISGDGILSVPDTIIVHDVMTVTVKCSSDADPSISKSLDVFLAPQTGSSFLGFVNNEVEYKDFYNRETVTKIENRVENNKTVYYNEKPIDLFSIDNGHLFNFIPVMRMGSTKIMHLKRQSITGQHSINWSGLYYDDEPTEQVPNITVGHPDFQTDNIIVTFECDNTIELDLSFNIWQSRDFSDSNPLLGYRPDEELGGKHSIDFKDQGIYASRLFCPSSGTGLAKGYISSIYAWTNRYDYSNLEYVIDDSEMDEKIRSAFSYKIEKQEQEIRHFDNMKFYKISISYTFDLSKISAASVGYKSLIIFRLKIQDKILSKQKWSYCDFSVKWI